MPGQPQHGQRAHDHGTARIQWLPCAITVDTVIVPDVRLPIGARHHVAIHHRISHAAAVGPRATRSA